MAEVVAGVSNFSVVREHGGGATHHFQALRDVSTEPKLSGHAPLHSLGDLYFSVAGF